MTVIYPEKPEPGGRRIKVTLTEFLLARIAEDEDAATAATPGPWQWEHCDWKDECDGECVEGQDWGHHGPDLVSAVVDPEFNLPADVISSIGYDSDQVLVKQSDGAHIARHDPARVLAECAAKRRIVERHGALDEDECPGCGAYLDGTWRTGPGELCPDLAALASVYADHPDYREEWRP